MNVAVANYAEADHAKVAVFHVIHHAIRRIVLLVIPGIPPFRAHLAGVNAVPIIQETVLLGATFAGIVAPQRTPEILLRLAVKRF